MYPSYVRGQHQLADIQCLMKVISVWWINTRLYTLISVVSELLICAALEMNSNHLNIKSGVFQQGKWLCGCFWISPCGSSSSDCLTWPDVTPSWKDTSDCVSAGRSDADVSQMEQNLVEQVQGLVHEEVHEVGRRLAPHSRINDLKTHSWWIIDSSPEDG